MINASEIQTSYHDDALLTLKEAAAYINMSQSFLKTIKYRNKIPFYKVGGNIKYKVADLKKFLEGCRGDTVTGKGADDV